MEPLTALADWEAFFTAQVGASATLAGLLFVGVSLNLTKVLAAPFLPLRALYALALLIGILVISSLLLMPGQTRFSVALEVLVVGLAAWAGGTFVEIYGWRHLSSSQHRATYLSNVVLQQAATIPYLVSAALLFGGDANALNWLAFAIVLSTVKAVLDAWVLLVEINR
jgi:modulator of FtsH protease